MHLAVDIYGAGYMYLYSSTSLSPIGGNWEVMNRYGETNSQTFTLITFDRYSGGLTALPADKTVNVWDGRVIFNDSDAIDGTLGINDGATLYVNRQITTGTINVDPGGALWVSTASGLEGLTWGTSLNVAPGAMLIPYVDVDTAANANFNQAMRVSDIVLDRGDADYFPGNGIVLGNGRYLMGPYITNADLLTTTAGLSADTGATWVGLAAFPPAAPWTSTAL